MKISKVLKYFITGGIIGYVWEKYIINKKDVKSVLIGNLPFLPVYGTGYVLIYIIGDLIDTILPKDTSKIKRIIIKTVIATVSLTSIECISGVLSEKYSGIIGWSYADEEDCPKSCIIGCKGYTTPMVSMLWAISCLTFYTFNKDK